MFATSHCNSATANHNQRKIVRYFDDIIYIVYQDIVQDSNIIKFINYNINTHTWSSPVILFNGKNPSLSINSNGELSLVYESDDSLSSILYSNMSPSGTWSIPDTISDGNNRNIIPVADVDSLGTIHIVWIEDSTDLDKVKYLNIIEDTINDIHILYTDSVISDVSVATNLQYWGNDVFVTFYIENKNMIHFLCSKDYGQNWNSFNYYGSHPCITIGLHPYPYNPWGAYSQPKLVYLDSANNAVIMEYNDTTASDTTYQQEYTECKLVVDSMVSYICVDDPIYIPVFGFGFLYIKNGTLFQAFADDQDSFFIIQILNTFSVNPIYPNIAYKHFNMMTVDYIWMEYNGNEYELYYKSADKFIITNTESYKKYLDDALTAFPNPFYSTIEINISPNTTIEHPDVSIYDFNGKLIKTLKRDNNSDYTFTWNAQDLNGNFVAPGTYIVRSITKVNKAGKVIVFTK